MTTRPDPDAAMARLGLTLPTPPKPVAAYIPWRRTGNLIFVSGQIPMREGKLIAKGAVPEPVSVDAAQECARQCVLNGLAVIRSALEADGRGASLSRVRQFVRVGVFVCSREGFTDQPKVANGASELIVEIFGEAGKHARAAVGNIALPLGAPVEVEFIVEVE